jgi:hypothetical protein
MLFSPGMNTLVLSIIMEACFNMTTGSQLFHALRPKCGGIKKELKKLSCSLLVLSNVSSSFV